MAPASKLHITVNGLSKASVQTWRMPERCCFTGLMPFSMSNHDTVV